MGSPAICGNCDRLARVGGNVLPVTEHCQAPLAHGFTIGQSSLLGTLLMAYAERGTCAHRIAVKATAKDEVHQESAAA